MWWRWSGLCWQQARTDHSRHWLLHRSSEIRPQLQPARRITGLRMDESISKSSLLRNPGRQDSSTVPAIWQQIPVPMVSRFLAQMGWDWLILDGQHGCFNYECIHTIRIAGVSSLVRITIGNSSEVERILDLGALVVIVPFLDKFVARELSLRSRLRTATKTRG